MRPFRFLTDPGEIADGRQLAAEARRAESMGYSAMVLPDHLVEQLAPIPVLATVAAATDRLRIAPFVLNNDLRHPAVLAQDLASLDVLSGGRLEIAIGAGWNKPEYDRIGLPFEPVAVRSARLEEAVAVLKGTLGDGPFSFHGTYYTITDHDGYPKPVQRPHPPLFIGGGGRRTLSLAGREADIVGLAPRILSGQRADPRSFTIAAAAEKIGWVREAAGDRFDRLEFNVYPSGTAITVTDHPRAEAAKVADRMRDRTGVELTVDEVLESPHIFIGSIDGFVEKFRLLRERLGISSFLVGGIDELAPVVERLAGS
ncbi:MAG: TIGR03621 family F420-dependent LLM class oxidoreductase [Candidatus Limnocylindrales bacterium]